MVVRTIERAALAFLLVVAFNWLNADREALRCKQPSVLVGLDRGTLSMPEGRIQATVDEVTIRSPELKLLLETCGARIIISCFPHFDAQDTIATSRLGRKVRLPGSFRDTSLNSWVLGNWDRHIFR